MIYFDTKETLMIEIKPKTEQQIPSIQNKCNGQRRGGIAKTGAGGSASG